MSTAIISLYPAPWFTGIDDFGNILPGGLLYLYQAGTTTLLHAYSDIDLTIPLPFPIVLDAAGRAVAYFANDTYKFVLKDADGVTIRTQDNVPSSTFGGDTVLGERFSFEGANDSPITLTAYPSGAGVETLHVGSGVLNVESSLLVGTFVLEAMILGSGGTVTVALVNLTDGAPDTPISTITGNNANGARVRGSAIIFAAPGAAKDYGIKVKVSAGFGFAWGIKLVQTA
jgi:hypothetical protein